MGILDFTRRAPRCQRLLCYFLICFSRLCLYILREYIFSLWSIFCTHHFGSVKCFQDTHAWSLENRSKHETSDSAWIPGSVEPHFPPCLSALHVLCFVCFNTFAVFLRLSHYRIVMGFQSVFTLILAWYPFRTWLSETEISLPVLQLQAGCACLSLYIPGC